MATITDQFLIRAVRKLKQVGHWRADQLEAIYARASEDARDYWIERTGIFRFDAGLDELTSANLAHLATIEALGRSIMGASDQIAAADREIDCMERELSPAVVAWLNGEWGEYWPPCQAEIEARQPEIAALARQLASRIYAGAAS